MRRRVWMAVIAVIVVAAGLAAWRFAGSSAQQAGGAPAGGAPQAIPVEAVPVKQGRITREIAAVGTLRSNESVKIRPEIAGRIARFNFAEGERVQKGQVLVKLDDSSFAAQLEQARASLALAEANNNRAQQLAKQGAGTERARDEASAKLRVDAAQVQVARAQLDKTEITAPFDGIVGLRQVSVGAYVSPGQDIVNLESLDPIKVDFRVPEVYLAAVKVGQTLTLRIDAYADRAFQGTVYAIDPAIDEQGRSILIRARIPNGDGLLRPGLFSRVDLVIDEVANALLIPEESLVPRGADLIVYKVAGGKADPVVVKVGKRRQGQVEILQGLVAEDVVVTAGQMRLRPGAAVNVVTPKQGA